MKHTKEIEIVFSKKEGKRIKNNCEKHTAIIVVKEDDQGEAIDNYKNQVFGRNANKWIITRSLVLK